MNEPNPYEAPKTESARWEPAERPRGWRWYRYALRRLPVSLLISAATLSFVLLLIWLWQVVVGAAGQ